MIQTNIRRQACETVLCADLSGDSSLNEELYCVSYSLKNTTSKKDNMNAH